MDPGIIWSKCIWVYLELSSVQWRMLQNLYIDHSFIAVMWTAMEAAISNSLIVISTSREEIPEFVIDEESIAVL